MPDSGILEELKGGDRRSIGLVSEVVRQVLKRPELVDKLLAGLEHEDPVVRLRAGDALEKVSRRHPEWLRPSRGRLLRLVSRAKAVTRPQEEAEQEAAADRAHSGFGWVAEVVSAASPLSADVWPM